LPLPISKQYLSQRNLCVLCVSAVNNLYLLAVSLASCRLEKPLLRGGA
jgi:hypothetical protein